MHENHFSGRSLFSRFVIFVFDDFIFNIPSCDNRPGVLIQSVFCVPLTIVPPVADILKCVTLIH